MSTLQNGGEPTLEMLEMYRLNRLMGMPQVQVAERFQVSQSAVSKTVARVEQWQRSQYQEEASLFRTRVTNRLEHLYSEAMQTWTISQAPKVVTTTRVERDGSASEAGQAATPERVVVTRQESAQTGNPAFLRIAIDAVEQLRGLWAEEIANTSHDGGFRYAGKSRLEVVESQLERLREMRERLIQREQPLIAGRVVECN